MTAIPEIPVPSTVRDVGEGLRDGVFYRRFERHAHGEGLKAHATHYCPGCGHGLVHKYLAEAIEDLGVQDRTIAISPVGCAVFLYYYFDVGNSQAAHGRAPAVALGHKLANPESIVVSYQGDGDLASIGLAEILHAAQLGVPISVIFVNNAIYGMTGGQMAPTTLLGQKTTTSPAGRSVEMGRPLKMAELVAGLDGPVYVERVALYDAKRRVRAARAIREGLRLQVENRGFSFVEVLSECPTHLGSTPEEAERWVREEMTKEFPLGVYKELDDDAEAPFEIRRPSYEPQALFAALGLGEDETMDAGSSAGPGVGSIPFPDVPDATDLEGRPLDDVALKFAGSGGDGVQTLGKLLCGLAIGAGFDGTYIPSYGPESRGGTSYADVHVARREVLSPSAAEPRILVAFNAPSVEKFAPAVQPGGLLLYDSTVVESVPETAEGVRAVGLPLGRIATELGDTRVKNVVALGALCALTGLFPAAQLRRAAMELGRGDAEAAERNEWAFECGRGALEELMDAAADGGR